ncbi:MAG: NAD-dependent protein deacylase [Clostridia bacterium]|nr:NAD-dependent protein deacylase [Clostridia bacterium]
MQNGKNAKIESLKHMLNDSGRIVFLGGAGVSCESGIPDFRSDNGIFKAISEYGYPPEELLSHTFFVEKPDIFFKYYRSLLLAPNARPNDAHIALAKLEQSGKLTAVITQNIDGLHQMAGSKRVFELHGSVHRNHCMKCRRTFDSDYVSKSQCIPYCPCGGIIKPDVVLYEEPLDEGCLTGAITHIMRADMLIVGGTSLQVYPAAGLINYYRGDRLVLINKSKTPYDSHANLVINDSIGEVLREAVLNDRTDG